MVDFRDTKEWLDRAREMGEPAVIKGADTKDEIGTLARVSPPKSHRHSVHRIRPINTSRRSDRVLKLQPKNQ